MNPVTPLVWIEAILGILMGLSLTFRAEWMYRKEGRDRPRAVLEPMSVTLLAFSGPELLYLYITPKTSSAYSFVTSLWYVQLLIVLFGFSFSYIRYLSKTKYHRSG